MGISSLFGFNSGGTSPESVEMPNLWPLPILQSEFVKTDVVNVYSKILTDVAERSHGLNEDQTRALFDNCLASESNEGLITLLAKGMYDKSDMFLVFDKATKVLRKADAEETATIKQDYKDRAESKVGAYISFKKYDRTDMIKLYSALEYLAIGSLNKKMNIAKALQLKMSDLRKSVNAIDSGDVVAQAKSIVEALGKGKDVLMDKEDSLESGEPAVTATEKALELFTQKRSFYLGYPASYVTGELNAGLGDSGQADGKAVERGHKNYFFSILRPACKAVFGVELTFKSEDYALINTALEVLKTFELVSPELISKKNQLRIVNKLLGFPEAEKGEPVKDETGTGDAGDDIQATALNGAQVTSLVAVATALQANQLGTDAAKAIISLAFPNVTDAQLNAIVKKVAGIKPPAPEPQRF